jgi:hypothetical protein
MRHVLTVRLSQQPRYLTISLPQSYHHHTPIHSQTQYAESTSSTLETWLTSIKNSWKTTSTTAIASSMENASTRRPQTMLGTLKHALGDDVYLLDHLPADQVGLVGPDDAKEGHVPYKIELGTTPEADDEQVTVFAYMSTAIRQKELPDIHFRGRTAHGLSKKYRLETVLSEGRLNEAFKQVKDLPAAAILVLLHVCIYLLIAYGELTGMECLFLVQGAPLPAECAISAKFINDFRTVCYRYKNKDTGNGNNNSNGAESDYRVLEYGADATLRTPQRSYAQASKPMRHELNTPTKLVSKVGYF